MATVWGFFISYRRLDPTPAMTAHDRFIRTLLATHMAFEPEKAGMKHVSSDSPMVGMVPGPFLLVRGLIRQGRLLYSTFDQPISASSAAKTRQNHSN